MSEITLKFEQFCDGLISKYFTVKYLRLHFVMICLGLFSVFLHFLEADPDLFARVAMGRLIEINGFVPATDPFAYTPTNPTWFDHEWLSGVFFYWLSQNGGDLALFLFKAVVAFLTVFFMARSVESPAARAMLWLFICAIPLSAVWNSNVRSHIFTFLFLAIYFWAVGQLRKNSNKAPLLFLPPLMTIWANAHGGFVLGLIFLATCLITEKDRLAIGLCLLACLSTTLINPYGLDYWGYIVAALTMQRPLITEWMPTNLLLPENWLFIFLVIISIAPIFKTPRGFLMQTGKLFLLISLYAAIKHNRFVPLFAMSACVFGFDSFLSFLNIFRQKSQKYFLMLGRSLFLLLSVCSLYSIFGLANFLTYMNSFSLSYQEYPTKAFDWLRANYAGGKVLVDFNNGSFALWRLYPNFRISLDGRFEEVYPISTYWDVINAYNPNSAQQKSSFNRIQPEFILLKTSDSLNLWQETFGEQWHLVYHDESYSILSKTAPAQTESPTKVVTIWEPLF